MINLKNNVKSCARYYGEAPLERCARYNTLIDIRWRRMASGGTSYFI